MSASGKAEKFFLNSGSEQLVKIHGWARARMVAPWAVFFGVLLRVSASVPPYVQLPPVRGGRASLNLLTAFVGRSGDGKGTAVKVAALAWPTDILTLPVGSGQGIAEMLKVGDGADIPSAIFDIPEIDTLTGLSSTQGSVLLPTLKSLAMGEQLGQANATKDARRIVPEHSYRACVSVGVQPGHARVLFGDTTGGTPQRFLWVPVIDPSIPGGKFPDPDVLDTAMPPWTPGGDGVVEIVYGVPEIEQSIRDHALASARGEGDPLDGHALLTRCKVAALVAIMHQRTEVTEWDWEISGEVIAVSHQARSELREREAQLEDNAFRERGRRDEIRNEGREGRKIESVKSSVIATMLRGGGSASHSDLNSAMGKSQRRKLLPQALEELAGERRVVAVLVSGGTRYVFPEPVQGEQIVQGVLTQLSAGERPVQGERSFGSDGEENRMSQGSGGSKVSCQKWYDGYIEQLKTDGDGTVDKSAVSRVRQAGIAAGYNTNQVDVAACNWRKREREKQAALSAAGWDSPERELALAV